MTIRSIPTSQNTLIHWYSEGGGITADRVRKPRTKGISSHDTNAPKLFNLGRWQCEAKTLWVYLELNATVIAYIYMFPKGQRCLVANLVPGKSDGIFRRLGPVDGGFLLRGILTLDPFITYTPISWPLSCEQSPTATLLDLSPEIHRVLRPRIKTGRSWDKIIIPSTSRILLQTGSWLSQWPRQNFTNHSAKKFFEIVYCDSLSCRI